MTQSMIGLKAIALAAAVIAAAGVEGSASEPVVDEKGVVDVLDPERQARIKEARRECEELALQTYSEDVLEIIAVFKDCLAKVRAREWPEAASGRS